jgi:hypothetical protein
MYKNNRVKQIPILIIIFCLLATCSPKKAQWQGRVEEVDGVTVVYNPEQPMSQNAGRVLQLKEELRITDSPEQFYFTSPHNIKVAPDGSLFILDEEQFLKFDETGRFIKNLFKKGQGPGEFERIGDYLFSDHEIVVIQGGPNKIVRLDMMGELIGEIRPEEPVSKLIACFKAEYITARSSFPKLEKAGDEPQIIDIAWSLKSVAENGSVEKPNLDFPVKWYAKRLRNAIIANFIVDFTAKPFMDKFLVIYHTQEYMLKLLDLESRQIVRAFTREYRSVNWKPEKTGRVETRPNIYTLVPPVDCLNDIQKLFIQEKTIWAMTSTMDEEKGILVDVFNFRGEYSDSFYLPLQHHVKIEGLNQHPLTIHGDSLFIVEYDENDMPLVVKYRILD